MKTYKTPILILCMLMLFGLLAVNAFAEGENSLPLRFVCDETVASVTVYDPAGLPVAVGADGIHHLTPGIYYYSAEAAGYENTGLQPFTVPADAAGDQELRISLTPVANSIPPDQTQGQTPQGGTAPGQTPADSVNPDVLNEQENPEDDGKLRIRPVDGSLTLTIERETRTESAVPPALQKLLEGKQKPLLTVDGKPVEKKLYLKTPDAEELYLDRLAVEKAIGYYTTEWTVLNLTDEEGDRKKLVPVSGWYDVTVSGPVMEQYRDYEPVFALLTLHWDEVGDIVDRDVTILDTTHTPTKSSWSFSTDTLSTLVIAVPTNQAVEAEEEAAKPDYPAFAASSTVDGVTVTVCASAGVFPADAALWVQRVPLTEEIDAAVEAERDESKSVAVQYTFDIRVVNLETSEEYQPAEGQSVSVSFALAEVADGNLETQVYHITEEEGTGALTAEALDVSESGLTATAETDGFSYYQVEFTYEKLEYVLPGNTSVPLSEILAELKLSGDVTQVVCSSPNLFSCEWTENRWVVTAHQAFSSTEWMKVTINNVVYEITVTDDSGSSTYPLWVGGVQVTSENKDDILGGGTASFDPASNTLTLTNANITTTSSNQSSGGVTYTNVVYARGLDLTISLSGVNTLGDASANRVIVTDNSSLIITGGSLTAVSGKASLQSRNGNISITGSTVIATSSGDGIYADRSVTISNSTVTATGSRYGIAALTGATISGAGSVVTATGGNRAFFTNGFTLNNELAYVEGSATAQKAVIAKAHAVTVEGGTADKDTAAPGELVTITANTPEAGYAFNQWAQVDGVDFDNASAAETTFIMPAQDVTVTAVFREILLPAISEKTYTGAAIEPTFGLFDVKLDGVDGIFVKGTHYNLSYSDNVNAGTATVTLTMLAPKTGNKSVTFQISKAPLTITANDQTYIYNGQTQGEGDTTYEAPDEIAEKIKVEGLQGSDTVTSITIDGQGQEVNSYELMPSNASISDHTANYDITYVPGTLTILSPATAEISVTKALVGRDWNEGDIFTFTLAPVTENAPMPTNTQVMATEADPTASFGEVTYDRAGTYEYTITEEDGGITGVNYDTTAHKVTVTVTKAVDATNALTTEVKYDGGGSLTVTNSRPFREVVIDSSITGGMVAALPASAAEGDPVTLTVTPDADSELTGLTVTNADTGAPVDVVQDPKDPNLYSFEMPAAGVNVLASFQEIIYRVVEGADSSWLKGSKGDVSIKVKRDPKDNSFEHFRNGGSVAIDGTALSEDSSALIQKDYKAEEGSTVITLHAKMLSRLSAGKHTVTITFDDGSVSTGLTILVPPGGYSPGTGDSSRIGFWAAVMIFASLGFAGADYGRRKLRRPRYVGKH